MWRAVLPQHKAQSAQIMICTQTSQRLVNQSNLSDCKKCEDDFEDVMFACSCCQRAISGVWLGLPRQRSARKKFSKSSHSKI